MNKNLKKVLITGASLLMLAGVGAGAGQLTQPARASRVYLDQYASKWERRDGITHWGVFGRGYMKRNGIPAVKYRAKTFYKNGHSFLVRDIFDAPGVIIGMARI